ncbi:ribosome hibernation-promoting factor, HPF/YfiA family [Adhaeribacter soli]|uniref:Ribosome-associated translation inhibitor RaiA n=1 Tax=Adhaeribacter soli TaxID=2607655 RepID=A0A5N1J366_9BACT|nr:ribosome-associated translation inhibitor RaiA [Adhaeribacter soli]KAA9341019.1 ribosome-associated translation inhibitor RaiA [Adhaeribacter soli]
MKLQMHSIHFDADQKLIDFIQQRLDKLETFYDRITEGEVFLRLNNNDGIANKTVEVKLFVPGATLFVKEEAPTFETATDKALDALTTQVKRHKEKMMSH